MTKKLYLTSLLSLCMVCPAMAEGEISTITNESQCDNNTLGTYSGTANVEALWNLVSQTCNSGQYFNKTTAQCETCIAGNYCGGGEYSVESVGDGSTTCPNGYALSDAGAGADTDCYRQCTTNDVAHSETVSGGYYYGDNNQCVPTSCASGWYVKEGVNLTQYANTNPTNSIGGITYYINNGGYNGSSTAAPNNAAYYGLTENNTWATDLGYYQVRGEARCSKVAGVHSANSNNTGEGDVLDNVTDETGQVGAIYCWCHISGVRANDQSAWQNVSSAWVFSNDHSSWSGNDKHVSCANYCASSCGNVGSKDSFRAVLFNSVSASCKGNSVTLRWYSDNTEIVPSNTAAGTCTYNETITLPTNEPTKAGYRFKGWKFRNSNNNNQ